jgi:DNA-binding phage protein
MPERLARVFDDGYVIKLLHAKVKAASSRSAFARQTGIDRAYLVRVLQGKKPPSKRILAVLDLRIVYAAVERRQKT